MRKTTKEIGARLPPDHPQVDLVVRAYAAFRCDKPQDPAVCSCCIDPKLRADFFSPDIEEMPLYYVQEWYAAAAVNPLPHALWTYLLPRVMEVVLCGEEPSGIGIEVTFRGETGKAELWSPEQWQVLDDFQRAVFQMQPEKYQWSLDDLICTFAKGGWSAEALWAQVLGWPDAVLAERLHRDWKGYHALSIRVSPFWQGDSRMHDRYFDPELGHRMEVFAYQCEDAKLAEKALLVAEAIRGG